MANWKIIETELHFYTSRSSGAGGQHVNKVETRVRVCFDIRHSAGLSEDEIETILSRLGKKRKLPGEKLCVSVQQSRQQSKNKELAIERLIGLLQEGLIREKQRKKTNIPTAEKEKRLADKRARSQRKEHRKPPSV